MTNYYKGYHVQSTEKNITIFNFLSQLLKYWYIIILFAAFAGSIAYAYTHFFITPTYSSTAKMFIKSKETEHISTTDFYISSALGKDYMELMTDPTVLEPVSEAIGGRYSSGQIKSFLRVNNPADTRFLEVTITCPDPVFAKEIVDTVCEISQEKFIEVLEVDRVSIIRKGKVPAGPSSPNITRNTIIGCMGGVICAVGLIFLLFILNDTIKVADDIEKSLELNVLATIPYSTNAKSYY